MQRRELITVLTGSGVLLAGCSSDNEASTPTDEPTETSNPTPEPTAEFSTTVDWPPGGVKGVETVVEVQVENVGDGAGEFEATLSAADDDLVSDSVTVEPGESATLTLRHVPGAAGTFDASVAGETQTITIYDNPLQFVDQVMGDVDTLRKEKEIEETGKIDLGGGPADWSKQATTVVEKNFEDETKFSKEEADLTVGPTPLEETTERWIVDGVAYQKKTKHTEGKVEYTKSFTDEPNMELSSISTVHRRSHSCRSSTRTRNSSSSSIQETPKRRPP